MKSAVIISGGTLAPGGVQTHLEYLIKFLIREGVDVVVVASGSQWSSGAVEALKAVGCKFLIPPCSILRWRKFALAWSVVVWTIHLWRRPFTSAYYIGGGNSHFFLKWLLGARVPSIYHEIVEAPISGSAEHRLASTLTGVIANSRKVAQAMSCTLSKSRIRVIPFLTSDSANPPPLTTAVPPGKNGEIRLVYLGRLVSHKRPDQLVYRWKELVEMIPVGPAILDVYGYDLSGEMIGSLQEYIRIHSLGLQVRVHGAYDFSKVGACLFDKHILVLPSLYEGLPLVLVEAMQRGIPVVACDSGGSAELAEDNLDVVITSTNWDDFALGLCKMAKKVRLGVVDHRRLQEWTEARYGFETVSKQWLKALTQPHYFFGL